MKTQKEFKFECIHCGKCCTDRNTLVNLTFQDILRIKKALDLSLDELIEIIGFYVFDKPPSEEELKKMVVPPIETERGLSFVGLRKKPKGTCYFYDIEKERCKIYAVRPMFCRTFPFTFKLEISPEDNTKAKIRMEYTEKAQFYCKGISEDAPEINEREWIQYGKQTIEEMSANNVLTDKWNSSVRQETIDPTVRNYLLTVMNLDKKKKE